MPAKMVAKSTEMNVKNAEAVPSFDNILNVRGREHTQEITNMIALKLTVRQAMLLSVAVIVFKYLAPTRTCKPYYEVSIKVLILQQKEREREREAEKGVALHNTPCRLPPGFLCLFFIAHATSVTVFILKFRACH